MFRSKAKKARDRERNRFYLLPGQGGRAFHRKQRSIFVAALVVGLVVSVFIALALYFTHISVK